MDALNIAPAVYTPFADLDLLLSEAGQPRPAAPPEHEADERDPETVDAFNAQILAGLVSP